MKTTITMLAALTLAACAPLTPNLDAHFGDSVNIIKAQQTLNPNASSNTALTTIDGGAAHETMGRYVKSYQSPTPQPNVFNIGVGSSGSGGK